MTDPLATAARHRDRSTEDRAAWIQSRLRAGAFAPVPLGCRGCEGGTQQWVRSDPAAGQPYPAPASCPVCNGTGEAPGEMRVEIAAFAGDEAARRVLGWGEGMDCVRFLGSESVGFDYLHNHWGPVPPVQAALGACRAWESFVREGASGRGWLLDGRLTGADRIALDQVAAWVKDPSYEVTAGTTRTPPQLLAFLFSRGTRSGTWEELPHHCHHVFAECAQAIGQDRAREAARAALIEWALGEGK